MDLPYKAEYAKSGRASCRSCKSGIEKGALRLAVMVQAPMFDSKMPNWYHYSCFFIKQRPKTVDDIEHFESLRWEDQEKIKKKLESSTVVLPETGKGKKRTKVPSGALKDFTIDYAKSSRAMCRGCELKIMKDEVRISKKDFETDVGKRYGGQDMWHHVTCFAKLRSELGYFADGSNLPGFNDLSSADKAEVKKQLPAIKQEDASVAKKIKKEDAEEENPLEKTLKKQTKLFFYYRDFLKELSKAQLTELLRANKQEVPPGTERILDQLADAMAFGALIPCPECKGQLVFNKDAYYCSGDLTEWAKCQNSIKEPKRRTFTAPDGLKEKFAFLKEYKRSPSVTVFKDFNPTVAVKKEETDGKPKIERERPPLYNMDFVLFGSLSKNKDDIKRDISKLGGKVTSKIDKTVMAVISNTKEVEKMGARMENIKDMKIHVVPEEFLDAAKGLKQEKVLNLVKEMSICDWGSDPATRLQAEPEKSMKSKSIYTSKVPSKVTMKLKGGTAVDPDSGLEDTAHVYVSGDNKYTAVLSKTDVQRGKNSYYKLQLLESDRGGKYWVFRSWGRIGTTIGGTKLDRLSTLIEAKQLFKELYEEKSGNKWSDRHNFKKKAGFMYPLDVDYTDETDSMTLNTDVPSKLSEPVQSLMKLIFNINDMKKLMIEFELDVEKMPLGKLSKSQITRAYGVLNELQALVKDNASESRFIDASNRFYTFVPHAAGVDTAIPILNTEDQIKQKADMLENLMELEIAYNLMKTSSSSSIDSHYEQLRTEIGVLERDSVEFSVIQDYVKNTHAKTHDNYELVITQVFTVKRHGEDKRFRPFRKLHNRKLLWHGSRITNYAGILSQGLRIAPPEAPVTGYMFGKGVYFADMVSKSANYCCTNDRNNKGLLLLCDVALGDMLEHTEATYIEKLPSGKHSCKGVGKTYPDPKKSKVIHDNLEVPLGKPVKDKKLTSSLLYNEFIVYDAAQVNIKYLVQVDFKYKNY